MTPSSPSSLAQRIFLAHLELSYRLGRKVTLAELGAMVATELGRDAPFTAAAVSRWENGAKLPSPQVIEAIAALTGVDPGWLSHGEKTAAPRPRFHAEPPRPTPVDVPAHAEPAREPMRTRAQPRKEREQRHRRRPER